MRDERRLRKPCVTTMTEPRCSLVRKSRIWYAALRLIGSISRTGMISIFSSLATRELTILISSYHGNTDSIIVCLALASVLAADSDRPILAGSLIALACGLKLGAILTVPAVILTTRPPQPPSALIAMAAVSGAVWIPGVILTAPLTAAMAIKADRRWGGRVVKMTAGTVRMAPSLSPHARAINEPARIGRSLSAASTDARARQTMIESVFP